MLKAVDKGMLISEVALHHKSGGRSGEWTRKKPDAKHPPPEKGNA